MTMIESIRVGFFSALFVQCSFVFISIMTQPLSTLKVGGIFDENYPDQELAFLAAAKKLSDSESANLVGLQLEGFPHNASFLDPYAAQMAACDLLQEGVIAIVDATTGPSSHHVATICDTYEVPMIQTSYSWSTRSTALSLKMYPKPEMLAKATMDLIEALKWKEFGIIYEDDEDIAFVNEFYKFNQLENLWKMNLFPLDSLENYREVFTQVRKSPFRNIVFHVKSENLYEALKQAQQVGLLTDRFAFIVTSLDLHAIDLEDFKYSRAEIYSFRIIRENSTNDLVLEWDHYVEDFKMHHLQRNTDLTVSTRLALVHDAIFMIHHGLLKAREGENLIEPMQLTCGQANSWEQGTNLLNYLITTDPNTEHVMGLTGKFVFDEFGYRTNIELGLYELGENGLVKSGYWTDVSGQGLNYKTRSTYYREEDGEDITRKVLRVVTVKQRGYTMDRIDKRALTGNDRFEGYVIDLVKELAAFKKFDYEFYLSSDEAYGNCDNTTMTCTGMLGEITSGNASMALVDLTITAERAQVVDFTHPFIHTGISILFKKITNSETDLFGFLAPFSKSVWLMIILTVVGVGFCLNIFGRLSPYEWQNPYPCRQEEDIHENDLNVGNSAWFIVAALMQQGSEIAPKTLSTRWLAGVWYFFTLILVSCYTANLAASLTVENTNYPITNAKDLVRLNTPEVKRIKFGCKSKGSTFDFFKNSKDPDYQEIYRRMSENADWLAPNNDEGVRRVRESDNDYAFFMESASIDYSLERNCSIVKIGGLLDHKGYGIAVKRNSPLLRLLNEGILHLQEHGVLQLLYDRWWKQRNGGGVCSSKPSNSAAVTSFKLINVGGVFIYLLIGCGVSVVIAFVELFIYNYKLSKDSQSFFEGVTEDIQFALQLQETERPNRKKSKSLLQTASEDKSSSKISNFSSKWDSVSGPQTT